MNVDSFGQSVCELPTYELRMDRRAAANKKYMSIAVTVVRGSQLSAPAPVARGRWSARNSATAYISVRCT
jgi:hypothetical protein